MNLKLLIRLVGAIPLGKKHGEGDVTRELLLTN